jgi:hypothetical protein
MAETRRQAEFHLGVINILPGLPLKSVECPPRSFMMTNVRSQFATQFLMEWALTPI